MSFRNPTLLLQLVAILGITGLVCAGGALDALGQTPSILSRLQVSTVSGILLLGSLCGRAIQQSRQQKRVLQQLDQLCELTPAELEESLTSDAWPAIAQIPAAAREPLQNIAQALHEKTTRLTDAEHSRAGVEVRARRLATECQQLREVFSGLSDPVLAVDPFGDVVLSNPSAQRLLGLPEDRTEKEMLQQLSQCEELLGLLTETRRRKGNVVRQAEVGLSDAEGTQNWYKITCRSLAFSGEHRAGDSSTAQGAVAVLTNISNQRAIQRRNAEFVSSVSHEMKTPLASIKAYVELLADGDAENETEREEFIEVINSQADRLQRLVENLLNLARIEAGVVSVNKTPRSLNELLQEAAAVLTPAAEQRNQKFVTDLSPLYLGVLADHDMLLQAAINLISNAIKYTRAGGTVTLRSRMNDQEVIFEVQDTGVGLNEEDRMKVFEKFYRVSKDKDMAPGTGLGLPLVKHIVEDVHNGQIEVESQLGVGSTFRICLPAVRQIQA